MRPTRTMSFLTVTREPGRIEDTVGVGVHGKVAVEVIYGPLPLVT